MKNKLYDYAVIIGRFQPFHNGHIEVLKKALQLSNKIVFVLGSSNQARSYKNPFSALERKQMIRSLINNKTFETEIGLWNDVNYFVYFIEANDYPYNNTQWCIEIQQQLKRIGIDKNSKVALVGNRKDRSSFYLDMFPQWNVIESEVFYDYIHATDIREKIFSNLNWQENLHPSVIDYIEKWKAYETEDYKGNKFSPYAYILEEFKSIQKTKEAVAHLPFPPIYVTVDNVVIKSGHVLLVTRKAGIGKGLLALPGGFVEEHEWLEKSARRELREETAIEIDDETLDRAFIGCSIFDKPDRSLRGRTITHVYGYDLGYGDLPEVSGGDDAAHAEWIPLHEVYQNIEFFFEDHAFIIQKFVSKI